MVGIGLVPAIPVVLLSLSALFAAGLFSGRRFVIQEGEVFNTPNLFIGLPILTVTCLLVLLALALSLLRTFANRACMLENKGVIDSYRRGLEVLGGNFGTALVLFLIQIAISITIGLILLVPGLIVALCCLLWPLLLLVQGTFAAYYSTLWTLAWNQWTGVPDGFNEGAVETN